jgi:hypothetical protein
MNPVRVPNGVFKSELAAEGESKEVYPLDS